VAAKKGVAMREIKRLYAYCVDGSVETLELIAREFLREGGALQPVPSLYYDLLWLWVNHADVLVVQGKRGAEIL
jgi:hypothetical protein